MGAPPPDDPGAPAPANATAPSRRLATAWGLLFSYASVAIALVRNLVLVPIYLTFISLEVYGAWAATGAVVAQLMIGDFGLMGVVTQRSAAAYGARDLDRLGRVVATSLLVAAGLSLVIGTAVATVSPWMPTLMRLEGTDAHVLARCFLIVALANAVNLFGLAAGGVLMSLQRPAVPGSVAIVSDLASVVVTLVLIFNDHGLYALAFGLATRSAVAVVGNGVGCLWICTRTLGLRLRWDSRFFRSLWWDSYLQFLTAIAMRLHVLADPFLVGLVLGAESAAIFTVTVRAHETVRLVWAQLGTAITPSLAHLHGEGNVPRFRHVFGVMTFVLALTSAVGMAGVLAFNETFVALWVGPGLYGGLALTAFYSLFGILDTLRVPPYNVLYAQGRFARLCGGMWIATLVRLPIALVLLPFGMWLAPLTASLGALVQAATFAPATFGSLGFERRSVVALLWRLVRVFVPPIALGVTVLFLPPAPGGWIGLALAGALFVGLALALVAVSDRGSLGEIVGEVRQTLAVRRAR